VTAKEGGEVVRNRQVDFFRVGCHIMVTGHVAGPTGDVEDVDHFDVSMSRQAEWVANTAAKKPNPFNKRMPVIVPADKVGVKHYGNICYFSVDYADMQLGSAALAFQARSDPHRRADDVLPG
jgi:hypothetical protein